MAPAAKSLASLVQDEGPFLSLYLNTEAKKEEAPKEIEVRWKDFRKDLVNQGAPEEILEAVAGLVVGAHRRGDGLAVIATPGGVVLNENLSSPIYDSAAWSDLPRLFPYLEWKQDNPNYGVVLVDRAGAEIHVHSSVHPDWTEHVEGDDYPIHRVKDGGWSQRRYQQRAENLWEKNAKEVADELTKVVA